MIHYKVYLYPYDWEVELYIVVTDCYINLIINNLKDSSQSEMQKMFLNLSTKIDSGFIKTLEHKSIIVINKPTTIENFVNIFNHEKNHLEMHICEEFNIDPYSEEAAVLSGNISKILFRSLMNELL